MAPNNMNTAASEHQSFKAAEHQHQYPRDPIIRVRVRPFSFAFATGVGKKRVWQPYLLCV
ncbi:hypothetical protein M5D96_009579 [Drosophila gunungcola]|uniref:Uncharacterized protein n=1 Tax=Drosophila gunungcola TaxID=103775 RepID=A0A9Q0BM09_9MUSC|nr:hypothetical protein M5D96_009579 [Drosophila gunungcola]